MTTHIDATLDTSPIDAWIERLQQQVQSLAPFDAGHDVLLRAERREFDGGNLVDSGRLRRSLTQIGGEHVWELNPAAQQIIFGTTVEYARYQRQPLFDRITQRDLEEVVSLAIQELLNVAH